MSNLKVLMFGWEFPPHNSGGLGTACYGLTKGLSRAHIDVTFVLPKKLEGYSHEFLKLVFANLRNVKFRSVKTLLAPYISKDSYDEHLRTMPDNEIYGLNLFDEVRRYGLRARAIAQEEKFDVIHAHDWLAFQAGIQAKRISGKPLIVHVHATEFDRTAGNPNQMIYDEEKKGMHEADCIIAVSHHTKQVITEHYGVPGEKIVVVHNGIDHEEWRQEVPSVMGHVRLAGKKIVLFVGRITIQKGLDYFLRAAQKTLQYQPNTVFVISGSGDMEHQMIRLAAELGISDSVIFAGFVRGEELARLYRAADLYVMPSVSEPFGITALEAAVNGTPIMVSKQSGVGEMMTHALKADFWDVDEMTNKIVSVLASGALKQTLGDNGMQDVAQATWGSAANKCIALYHQMTSKV